MSAHDEQQAKILDEVAQYAEILSVDNADRIRASLRAGAAALRRASPKTGWQALEALKVEVMELHARECDSLKNPAYLDAIHHVRELIDARLSPEVPHA